MHLLWSLSSRYPRRAVFPSNTSPTSCLCMTTSHHMLLIHYRSLMHLAMIPTIFTCRICRATECHIFMEIRPICSFKLLGRGFASLQIIQLMLSISSNFNLTNSPLLTYLPYLCMLTQWGRLLSRNTQPTCMAQRLLQQAQWSRRI